MRQVTQDFPVLSRRIHGKRIVYLDSTATALKPKQVIDAVNGYYKRYTANVFRGIYTLSEEATAAYEAGRESVRKLVNAASAEEVVFTRNTSESLNLVAYSWLPGNVKPGDVLATTIMEHHSNFVPWQQFAKRMDATFKIMYVGKTGQLDLDSLDKIVTRKTKVFAFSAASNVLGTITPVAKIAKAVKRINPSCLVVVDAAQAAPHMPVDVAAWGADAVAFSGHKMLSPSGIGVLWMRRDLLERMDPFLYGGDMIREVHETETVFNGLPHKFEAGTPFIEGAIGIGAAADYLMDLGLERVREHERDLTAYALAAMSRVKGMRIYGPTDADKRGGVIAFRVDGIHPHDLAQLLDRENVCIRVGYHCAMPLHEYLGIGPTARASFYVYNTKADADALVVAIEKAKSVFA